MVMSSGSGASRTKTMSSGLASCGALSDGNDGAIGHECGVERVAPRRHRGHRGVSRCEAVPLSFSARADDSGCEAPCQSDRHPLHRTTARWRRSTNTMRCASTWRTDPSARSRSASVNGGAVLDGRPAEHPSGRAQVRVLPLFDAAVRQSERAERASVASRSAASPAPPGSICGGTPRSSPRMRLLRLGLHHCHVHVHAALSVYSA